MYIFTIVKLHNNKKVVSFLQRQEKKSKSKHGSKIGEWFSFFSAEKVIKYNFTFTGVKTMVVVNL